MSNEKDYIDSLMRYFNDKAIDPPKKKDTIKYRVIEGKLIKPQYAQEDNE